MKTIKQWLKEYWEREVESFERALSRAFIWPDTIEDWHYWNKIFENGGSLKTDPIVEEVCEDLQRRSAVGVKKYGKTLDRDDMDAQDWAREMFHELLDASLYCKRLIKELEKIKQNDRTN